MDAEHLSSLRQAATALINSAAAPVVLAALRVLLADFGLVADSPTLPLRPSQLAAPPPRTPMPRSAQKQSAATLADPAWDELRRAVRQAMLERGLDFAGLAQMIGRSATALRIDLTSRKPARPIVQAKLKAWLEGAPEVAAAGAPFRVNGASNAYADAGISFGGAG